MNIYPIFHNKTSGMYISSPVRITLLLLSFCVRYFPIKSPGYDHSILSGPLLGRTVNSKRQAYSVGAFQCLFSLYPMHQVQKFSPSELDFILAISSVNYLPRAILFSLSHRGTTQPLQRLKTFQPLGALCAPLPLPQQCSSSHSWVYVPPRIQSSPANPHNPMERAMLKQISVPLTSRQIQLGCSLIVAQEGQMHLEAHRVQLRGMYVAIYY